MTVISKAIYTTDAISLSEGQLEVLQLMSQGQSVKQIANDLGMTESAIKRRLGRARDRLNATTTAQCLALAVSCGLVHPTVEASRVS